MLPAKAPRRFPAGGRAVQWAQAVEVPFMDWEMLRRYVLIALFRILAIVGVFTHMSHELRTPRGGIWA